MAVDQSLLKDVLTDLKLYKDFIIKNDIPAAIKGNCNYLAALGLSTYTEVFGGLYQGDLRQGRGKKNYDAFIKDFFHKDYIDVDRRLEDDGLRGLYGAVRSGLVHEYLIKDTSIVVMYRKSQMSCAILYDPMATPKIMFVVEQYFDDFKNAFNGYYSRIQKEPNLVDRFVAGLNSISSPLPRGNKIL